MIEADVLIIGGGAVGLAVGLSLVQRKFSVIIVEKENRVGSAQSERNSGVIHSGIYYPPSSLKSQLCIEGRHRLYRFCQQYQVPFRKTGKWIVAHSGQEGELDRLYALARDKGLAVEEVPRSILTKTLSAKSAIRLAETGIFSQPDYLRVLSALFEREGGILALGHRWLDAEWDQRSYRSRVAFGEETMVVRSSYLINSAGLYADRVSQKVIGKEGEELVWVKGSYCRIPALQNKIDFPVYPVPDPQRDYLGLHLTPDLAGMVRLGPDYQPLPKEAKFHPPDYHLDKHRWPLFWQEAKRLWPHLRENDLNLDYAGIRAKRRLCFSDFYIAEQSSRGFPRLIDLIGIDSPGLTASLAIGNYVACLVRR